MTHSFDFVNIISPQIDLFYEPHSVEYAEDLWTMCNSLLKSSLMTRGQCTELVEIVRQNSVLIESDYI